MSHVKQVGLIIHSLVFLFTMIWCIQSAANHEEIELSCYILLGPYQVISAIAHLPIRKYWNWPRTAYVTTLFLVLGSGLAFSENAGFSALYAKAMHYIAPVMAIWYYATCLMETIGVLSAEKTLKA